MKLFYAQPLPTTPLLLLQAAGYHPFTDPRTHETSFVRHLGSGLYPRFHLYLTEEPTRVIFDFHLDQKQASYNGSHKHNGEYDGPPIEAEAARIREALRATMH